MNNYTGKSKFEIHLALANKRFFNLEENEIFFIVVNNVTGGVHIHLNENSNKIEINKAELELLYRKSFVPLLEYETDSLSDWLYYQNNFMSKVKILTDFQNVEHEDEHALFDYLNNEILMTGDYYHDKIEHMIDGYVRALMHEDYLVATIKEEIDRNHAMFKVLGFYENPDKNPIEEDVEGDESAENDSSK